MDEEKKQFSMFILFMTMLQISAFTFGGGFVIIGMMRQKFCQEYHWLTDQEALNMTAIAQTCPGALAVNSAIIFGYQIAGIKGALISALATIIPPLLIISAITYFYNAFVASLYVQTALRVMRAGVAAVIADVVIDLGEKVICSRDIFNIILMLAAFAASWAGGVSSITIILIFIVIGLARSLLARPEDGRRL